MAAWAPLVTWDNRHFLHPQPLLFLLQPSGPRGLPIRPGRLQLCPEALDQPHPLGLELKQNQVAIPALDHRFLAPGAVRASQWAAAFAHRPQCPGRWLSAGRNGAASGAGTHRGDHPRGSSPQALQACKLGCSGLGGGWSISPRAGQPLSSRALGQEVSRGGRVPILGWGQNRLNKTG